MAKQKQINKQVSLNKVEFVQKNSKKVNFGNQYNNKKKADLRTEFEVSNSTELADKDRLSIDKCFAEQSIPQGDRFIF